MEKGGQFTLFLQKDLWRTDKYENVYLQINLDEITLKSGLSNYLEFYNQEKFHQ